MNKKAVNRIERFRVDGEWQKTPEGYLRAKCFATRTGVFPYTTASGECVKELRVPSEVFNENSFTTLNNKPLTWLHPDKMVNSENWTQFARGHTHEDARQENEYLAITVTATEKSLVEMIEQGNLREVSCGYTCDLDPTPGVEQGMAYDCVQRNIVYNHLAVVPKGRAGSDVCLKLDAAEINFHVDSNINQRFSGGSKVSAVPFAIKGITVQVEANSLQSLSDKVRKDEMSLGELEAEILALKAKVDTLMGEKAVLDEQNKGLSAELEKTKDGMSEEKVDALIESRVQLREKAKTILGASTKFDGKSEKEIVEACVIAKMPHVKLDGKSPDFLRGMFDTLSATTQFSSPTKSDPNGFNPETKNDSASRADWNNIGEFQKNNHKDLKNLWKTKK